MRGCLDRLGGILLFVCLFCSVSNGRMEKHTVTNAISKGAICNDGTEAVYFLEKRQDAVTAPISGGSRSWVIYLMGGGACLSNSTCADRDPALVSSNNLPTWIEGMGILTNSASRNPTLFAANKVLAYYCSSDLWIGNTTFEGVTFHGENIFKAIIEDTIVAVMQETGVVPEEIVLAGESAGGAASTYYSSYMTSKFPTTRVLVSVDSSIWSAGTDLSANLVSQLGANKSDPSLYNQVMLAWAPTSYFCTSVVVVPIGDEELWFPCCIDVICSIHERFVPRNVSVFILQPMLDGLLAVLTLEDMKGLLGVADTGSNTDGQNPQGIGATREPGLLLVVDNLLNLRSHTNISDPRNFLQAQVVGPGVSRQSIMHAPVTTFQPSCMNHVIVSCVADMWLSCDPKTDANKCIRDNVTLPVYGGGVQHFDKIVGSFAMRYTKVYDDSSWDKLKVKGMYLKDVVALWVNESRTLHWSDRKQLKAYFDVCKGPSCNPTCPESFFIGLSASLGSIDVYIYTILGLLAAILITFILARIYDMPRARGRGLNGFKTLESAQLQSVNSTYIMNTRSQATRDQVTQQEQQQAAQPRKDSRRSRRHSTGVSVEESGIEIQTDCLSFSVPLPSGAHINLLEEITIRIKPDEVTALMGPSGSGKTTFLDVLACRRSSGHVFGNVSFNGVKIGDKGAQQWLRENSGYVLQLADPALPMLSTLENLMFAADLRLPANMPLAKRQARVFWVVDMLEMHSFLHTKIQDGGGGISGGQRRRLAVGIQLLKRPQVIFLDEPTSGLDSTSALDFAKVMRRLAVRGHTVLLSIHQPRVEVWNLFHKVILLVAGRVVYHGPPDCFVDRFSPLLEVDQIEQLSRTLNVAHTLMDLLKDRHVQKQILANSKDLRKNALALHGGRDGELSLVEQRAQQLEEDMKRLRSMTHASLMREHQVVLTFHKASHLDKVFTQLNRGMKALPLNPIVTMVGAMSVMSLLLGILYFQPKDIVSVFSGVLLSFILPSAVLSSFFAEVVCIRKHVLWMEVDDGVISGWHFVCALFIEAGVAITFASFIAFSITYLMSVPKNWYDTTVWFKLCMCDALVSLCHAQVMFLIEMLVETPQYVYTLNMCYIGVAGILGGVLIPKDNASLFFRWIMELNPTFEMGSVASNLALAGRQGACDYDMPQLYCPLTSGNYVLYHFSMLQVDPQARFIRTFAFLAAATLACVIVAEVKTYKRVSSLSRNMKVVGRTRRFSTSIEFSQLMHSFDHQSKASFPHEHQQQQQQRRPSLKSTIALPAPGAISTSPSVTTIATQNELGRFESRNDFQSGQLAVPEESRPDLEAALATGGTFSDAHSQAPMPPPPPISNDEFDDDEPKGMIRSRSNKSPKIPPKPNMPQKSMSRPQLSGKSISRPILNFKSLSKQQLKMNSQQQPQPPGSPSQVDLPRKIMRSISKQSSFKRRQMDLQALRRHLDDEDVFAHLQQIQSPKILPSLLSALPSVRSARTSRLTPSEAVNPNHSQNTLEESHHISTNRSGGTSHRLGDPVTIFQKQHSNHNSNKSTTHREKQNLLQEHKNTIADAQAGVGEAHTATSLSDGGGENASATSSPTIDETKNDYNHSDNSSNNNNNNNNNNHNSNNSNNNNNNSNNNNSNNNNNNNNNSNNNNNNNNTTTITTAIAGDHAPDSQTMTRSSSNQTDNIDKNHTTTTTTTTNNLDNGNHNDATQQPNDNDVTQQQQQQNQYTPRVFKTLSNIREGSEPQLEMNPLSHRSITDS